MPANDGIAARFHADAIGPARVHSVVRCVDGGVSAWQSSAVKVREVLERLHNEGWSLRRQKGSHRQFFHPSHPGRRVTVSGHPHLDIPKGN